MINKKFMILTIFLVSLLAVSAVSAADNATEDIVGTDNNDKNQTIEESSNEEILSGTNDGTFTELQNKIDKAAEGSTIYLDKDYKYDEGFSKEGISISKSLTIAGNGHTLDALSKSRILYVSTKTKNSEIFLNDINFCNGYANNDGGAIVVDNQCTDLKKLYKLSTSIKGCTFTNNVAGESAASGGAIDTRGMFSPYLYVSNSVFKNNKVLGSSVYGGAISASELDLSHSTFISNIADSGSGGAVAIINGIHSASATIKNCQFSSNSATESGGAIYGKYIDLDSCIFTNNEAKDCGGAFYFSEKSTIKNSTFNQNKAQQGGAIGIVASTTVQDSKFTNNVATAEGGAIYCLYGTTNIYNSGFASNTAENGGAIYNVEINPYTKSTVIANAVECTFKSNKASQNQNVYGVNTIDCIFGGKSLTLTAKYDSASKNIVATVKDEDGKVVSGIKVGFAIDGVKYVTTNSNGQAKYSTSGLANKKYSVNVMAYGDEIYEDSNKVTVTFDLSKIKTTLMAPDVVTTYNSGKNLVATLKDSNGKAISGAKVTIKLGTTTKTLTTNSNGQVSLTTDGLIPDTYVATISFEGNDVYDKSSTTAKVTINKLDTKLTARYDANSKNIVATVKDSNGNPVKGLRVGFALNGVKYATTDANGQAKYSTAGLADGTYKVTVQASGNEIYKDSNKETVTFTIGSKEMSKIFLRNALYFVTQTKLVQVTLWDGNNQPLANKTVYIRAYDSVWHGVTDENGDAFVRVGIGFGTHDATVSFDGDDQYFGSEKAGYIRVIKQTPSVMVRGADTMFKATNPVKIVKVHLRDRYDQPLPEGSKIVLKLNGKTYIGFTDAEGVASIAISINTVGTFTAQAMYGGNTAYNPVTRDVKIRIV